MTEGQIAELKAAHGTLFRYDIGGQTFVFRRANRADYRRLKTEGQDDKRRVQATENLAAACLVFPDRETYNLTLEHHPAFADRVASDLVDELTQADAYEKKVL